MKIERDKWYVTRAGDRVRVLCVDAPNEQPVIVLHADGEAANHRLDGRYYVDDHDGEASLDLVSEYVEPPKPREVWVNVSRNDTAGSAWFEHELSGLAAMTVKELVKFREVIE